MKIPLSEVSQNAGKYTESLLNPSVRDFIRALEVFGMLDAPIFIRGTLKSSPPGRITVTSDYDFDDGKFHRFVEVDTEDVP